MLRGALVSQLPAVTQLLMAQLLLSTWCRHPTYLGPSLCPRPLPVMSHGVAPLDPRLLLTW